MTGEQGQGDHLDMVDGYLRFPMQQVNERGLPFRVTLSVGGAIVGAEEAWGPFSPTELDPEVAPVLIIGWAEPLAPEGPSAASLRTYPNG